MQNGQPPDDFRVQYEWRAGTMPPPHHYKYTVIVGPGTEGKVVFQPDYDSADVPVWTETFTITEEQRASLYSLAVKNNLLRDNWVEESNPPVGGSVEWAEITASGKQYSIPSALRLSDQEEPKALYEEMSNIVPRDLWDKLMAQRDQYAKEYEERR